MGLDDEAKSLQGVGDKLAEALEKQGITSVADLVYYFPYRYEDYSNVVSISKLRPGPVTIIAQIKQVSSRYGRGRLHITEALASDETGNVRLTWFNQSYRAASLKADQNYFISGQFDLRRGRLGILNPSVELVQDLPANTARILPVYHETKDFNSKLLRRVLRQTLPLINDLSETLPAWLVKELGLISYAEAIRLMHFPLELSDIEKSQLRLGFEELFTLSLASLLNRESEAKEHSVVIKFDKATADKLDKSLPFKLTEDQRYVVRQIFHDLQSDRPMNRLVEGDVGSGKTVVATFGALMAMQAGYQVAFLAPTELLAQQHGNTIYNLMAQIGRAKDVSLLTGSMNAKQKSTIYKAISSGQAGVVVGTHALLQEKINFSKLGLLVIDEQHRFGVEQRQSLIKQAGHMPHVLSLSATPIPRSLALTLYGEIDVSLIKNKPFGRQQIKTKVWPSLDKTRLYEQVNKKIDDGEQVFVVCPQILDGKLGDSGSVQRVYKELSQGPFKHREVTMLHGKMKSEEKNSIMKQFLEGKIDVLVSTTVIEVGVDIPNATVMIIEAAERYGLAQLHQLRGRVGRGDKSGFCYLLPTDPSQVNTRLKALESSNDGFKLAELDLKIRGPGAVYGTLQHGHNLRVARFDDAPLLKKARASAQAFIDRSDKLSKYPILSKAVHNIQAITYLN